MTLLSNITAQLESGGGTQNALQPASMVDPTYGQYADFVKQYGRGSAGVENYASQFLAANPNATLGDFYANYVLGTGNPRNPAYSLESLENTKVPGAKGAYKNLISNAGVPPDTSLASLLSGTDYGTGMKSASPNVMDFSAMRNPLQLYAPIENTPPMLPRDSLPPGYGAGHMIALLGAMGAFGSAPTHKFQPIDYDPWKVAPNYSAFIGSRA